MQRKYDFDTVLDRTGTGSVKWEEMKLLNPNVSNDIVPFSIADMEFLNPPEIREGLKKYLNEVVLGYQIPTENYVSAVIGWSRRRYGGEPQNEWLISTLGVINAFCCGIRAFTKERDGVILMTPVYYPFEEGIRNNNRKLLKCPLKYEEGKYTVNYSLLEQLAGEPESRLLILCNPHNPVGRVWTRDELLEIGRICRKHHIFVLSDEVHCDIIMDGYDFTSYGALSPEHADNVMICFSPGKTFNLAGIKSGCVLIKDERKRQAFYKELEKTLHPNWLPALSFKAVEIAYTECDEWLGEMLSVLNENKRLLKQFLRERIPKVHAVELEGTYLQWLDFNAYGFSGEQLNRILIEEAQLFFDEGASFGSEGEGFERMNLACPQSVIVKALERMEMALKKY